MAETLVPPRLDPIVSLSVSLAEAPGTIACLLGAGISKDAGVPLAGEIVRDLQRRVYQAEHPDDDPPSAEQLDEWLTERGLDKVGYSELMDEALQDPATRRSVLAGYFEGKSPGRTHELLAELAEAGYLKVFVTTNFDPLLEWALQARGLDPVVVSTEEAIANGVPREHARCYVIKPHGDYTEQTLRNTTDELSELPAGVADQLREVFDRFGLLMLGYSGSDAAIREILRGRNSHYGVWWQVRSTPDEELAQLLTQLGARTVERESAATLLEDLERRLRAFRRAPSGNTPASVHDQLLGLIQRGDRVGAAELRRDERNRYESALAAISAQGNQQDQSVRLARETVEQAGYHFALIAPLALYDVDGFQEELDRDAELLARPFTSTNTVHWMQLARWPTWLSLNALGAVLLREARWDALGVLLTARYLPAIDYKPRPKPLVDYTTVAGYLAKLVVSAPSQGKQWRSSILQQMIEFASQAWMVERYAPLEHASRELIAFDLIAAMLAPEDVAHRGHWRNFETTRSEDFARRMLLDQTLVQRLAEAGGLNEATHAERLAAMRARLDASADLTENDSFGMCDVVAILAREEP